jgi:ribonucleoside-diphosphate reductase alpha subunit
MSPDDCPRLNETYGKEFEDLYNKYVSEGKYREKVKALDIWERTLVSQIETGVPYIAFKDRVNERCNQKNIGIVKSSNLCCEITEVSDLNTHSVCNLASIAVNKFYEDGVYNYDKLREVAKLSTINLNKVIDINAYPTPESKETNLAHRPIGVGIQGLADLFCMMKIPFESEEAIKIDGKIMEHIYYGCIEGSIEMAEKDGPYKYFKGSPYSQGILQFDFDERGQSKLSSNLDWINLKERMQKSGMRNSLLTALMPTASTSQILGNNECFEPYTSNIYTRSTQAGEFIMINKHLIKDLIDLKIWDNDMREQIIINNGSVQDIEGIPNNLKEIYKTVWEIKQKAIIDHSVIRGYFTDQSQSQNLFFPEPDTKKLSSALIYGWKQGLKTGMYYLRSKPATSALKFTIDANKIKSEERRKDAERKKKTVVCNDDDGICLMCSS